jgi:hypothetical protein
MILEPETDRAFDRITSAPDQYNRQLPLFIPSAPPFSMINAPAALLAHGQIGIKPASVGFTSEGPTLLCAFPGAG